MKDIDPHSPTWVALRAWLLDALEAERLELEVRAEDPEFARGRISMIREIMALPQRNRPVEGV